MQRVPSKSRIRCANLPQVHLHVRVVALLYNFAETFKVNPQPNTSNTSPKKNDVIVSCKAEGTNVEFGFEKPVLLAKLLIHTPGNNQGPAGNAN